MKTRLIVAWLGNLIDLIATLYLVNDPVCVELNPISAFLLQFPPLFAAVKLIVPTVAVLLTWRFRERKLFQVASWALFVVYLFVAVYYACFFTLFY